MTRLQRREQGQIARPTQFDNEQANESSEQAAEIPCNFGAYEY